MRFLLCIAIALAATPLHAAVYKCTGANGAVEFKDKPCAPGNGGEITVKGVARSDETAPRATTDDDATPNKSGSGVSSSGGGDSKALTGSWCEYAISMGADGEKDESAPAQWTINGDSLEYRMKAGGVIKSRIIRNGSGFALEHGMLGGPGREWQIISQKGDTMVLSGPLGGHFHLRRGSCR